jgi:hypothetical protein
MGSFIFLCGKGKTNHHLETDSFIFKGTGPAVLLVIICDICEVSDVRLF